MGQRFEDRRYPATARAEAEVAKAEADVARLHTQTLQALRVTTQAIKDILGAARNGHHYDYRDLTRLFSPDYNVGRDAIIANGLEEIA